MDSVLIAISNGTLGEFSRQVGSKVFLIYGESELEAGFCLEIAPSVSEAMRHVTRNMLVFESAKSVEISLSCHGTDILLRNHENLKMHI